jgi:hypothetical protein
MDTVEVEGGYFGSQYPGTVVMAYLGASYQSHPLGVRAAQNFQRHDGGLPARTLSGI